MTNKVLIVGAGAIGSFYGALLAKSGSDVSVVCRSDYPTVKQKGYTIKSDVLGTWRFNPSQVVKSAADYQGKPDYIILCTKVIPEVNRVTLIEAAVTNKTSIVFIQNGIDIEQELIDAFPNNEIISGLAFICCNRIESGYIHHLAYGKLTLGNINPTNTQSKKLAYLSHLIGQAGIEAVTTDNIMSSRWLKCLWNAPFNPLSVLSDGLSTKDIIQTQEPIVRAVMQEVCNIAEASGHRLPLDSIDINIENTLTMPAYKTSMLLDYENNQTMEIEAILGNTVKKAQSLKIASPILDSLYALMTLKALNIQQSLNLQN